jgi:hypothetical protein
MTKRTVVVIVAFVAALAVMVGVLWPDLLTAEGRRLRFLRSLERGPLVVRRNCVSMETFVQGSYWQAMPASDQQRAGQALGDYCREQGAAGQMTIVEAESKRKLAHWDGSTLQRF